MYYDRVRKAATTRQALGGTSKRDSSTHDLANTGYTVLPRYECRVVLKYLGRATVTPAAAVFRSVFVLRHTKSTTWSSLLHVLNQLRTPRTTESYTRTTYDWHVAKKTESSINTLRIQCTQSFTDISWRPSVCTSCPGSPSNTRPNASHTRKRDAHRQYPGICWNLSRPEKHATVNNTTVLN